MTAPRPTRERVDAALADLYLGSGSPRGDLDRRTLGAEVRALRAELAARTPQPAERDRRDDLARDVAGAWRAWRAHHAGTSVLRVLGGELYGALDRLANEVLRDARDAPAAPQPAVPDGEDRREALGRRVREVWVQWAREQPDPKPSWLVGWDELDDGQREVDMRIGEALAAQAPQPADEDGEDVPARLEAAADALDAAEWGPPAVDLRAVAATMRVATVDVRAAVAAALAGGAS